MKHIDIILESRGTWLMLKKRIQVHKKLKPTTTNCPKHLYMSRTTNMTTYRWLLVLSAHFISRTISGAGRGLVEKAKMPQNFMLVNEFLAKFHAALAPR